MSLGAFWKRSSFMIGAEHHANPDDYDLHILEIMPIRKSEVIARVHRLLNKDIPRLDSTRLTVHARQHGNRILVWAYFFRRGSFSQHLYPAFPERLAKNSKDGNKELELHCHGATWKGSYRESFLVSMSKVSGPSSETKKKPGSPAHWRGKHQAPLQKEDIRLHHGWILPMLFLGSALLFASTFLQGLAHLNRMESEFQTSRTALPSGTGTHGEKASREARVLELAAAISSSRDHDTLLSELDMDQDNVMIQGLSTYPLLFKDRLAEALPRWSIRVTSIRELGNDRWTFTLEGKLL